MGVAFWKRYLPRAGGKEKLEKQEKRWGSDKRTTLETLGDDRQTCLASEEIRRQRDEGEKEQFDERKEEKRAICVASFLSSIFEGAGTRVWQ